jgi:hypothetical protein
MAVVEAFHVRQSGATEDALSSAHGPCVAHLGRYNAHSCKLQAPPATWLPVSDYFSSYFSPVLRACQSSHDRYTAGGVTPEDKISEATGRAFLIRKVVENRRTTSRQRPEYYAR